MRALILLLAAAVVGLAAEIVRWVDARPDWEHRTGPTFRVGRLLADAAGGEHARYRETTSRRWTEFEVEQAPRLPPEASPWKIVRRTLLDANAQPYANEPHGVAYRHRLTDHGWFPLLAPEAPQALDRVWIVRSIRTDVLTVLGEERSCWRVDCIDPALPEGSDTVVAWLDPAIPVFGLLKWKRAGETWELASAETVR
jgi:hypothetical protein